MEIDPGWLPGLTAALGLGMLIGIERERAKGGEPDAVAAGVRTHTLLALLGAVATILGTWPLVVLALAVTALTTASYLHGAHRDPGLTGEIGIMLTFALGALAMSTPLLAAALGVLTALLLAAKPMLHRLTRELISEREMRDLLILAATALIVLPLLPDEPLDPWDALQPSTLGRLVVLVMAIGAAGHVAVRVVGARWGLPVAGFFAGFASSTAATAGFGQRVRLEPALRRPAVAAAVFANLASLLLFALLIGSVAPALLLHAAWAFGAAGLVLLAAGALGLWHAANAAEAAREASASRAFRLSHALIFAAIVAAVVLLSAWLGERFGSSGVLLAAGLVALAELHAAAASIAQLSAGGSLDPDAARWGLIVAFGASVIAKSAIAVASGGVVYGLRVTGALCAALSAALLVALLAP